jgi:hypothetical protein
MKLKTRIFFILTAVKILGVLLYIKKKINKIKNQKKTQP